MWTGGKAEELDPEEDKLASSQEGVEEKITTMLTDLSEDLLIEILLRLPVISLLKSRCVCKTWYFLIASSKFISDHLNHNMSRNNYHVIIRGRDLGSLKCCFSLHSDNRLLDKVLDLGSNDEFMGIRSNNDNQPIGGATDGHEIFRILGCINGLISLLNDHERLPDTWILWNPLIKKSLVLPEPLIQDVKGGFGAVLYGFGFDPKGNDYKIIRILDASSVKKAEIFRLSMKSWAMIELSSSLPLLSPRQAYLNGFVHWLGRTDHLIVAFDMGAEVFRIMALPKEMENTDIKNVTIAVWCGYLSLFEFRSNGNLCLWIMKEYGMENSWIQHLNLEGMNYKRIRGIRTNGELVFETVGNVLQSFVPGTKEFKDFPLRINGPLNAFHMKSYMPTLVLLDQQLEIPALQLWRNRMKKLEYCGSSSQNDDMQI